MLLSRMELKEEAKKSLKGKYGQYIILIIVTSLLTGGISSLITFIFKHFNLNPLAGGIIVSVVTLLITSFITLGANSFSLKIARNEEVKWTELFSKANMWFVVIVATLLIQIFTSLWTILLIIPGLIAVFKYSMTYYVLVDEPEIGALGAISKSKELMNGHKLDLFILMLSFLGWILLGLLTFGLLYIWLVPYINVTYAKFYDSIKK